MQRKGMYAMDRDRVGLGYILKNMMTIGLVVSVMYHFMMRG